MSTHRIEDTTKIPFPCDLIKADGSRVHFINDPAEIMRACKPDWDYVKDGGFTHYSTNGPDDRPEDVGDSEPCGGRCVDPKCELTVTGEPVQSARGILRALLSEVVVIDEKHRLDLLEGGYERIAALFRQEARPTPDLARLAEAAAKEIARAHGAAYGSPYERTCFSTISRHFEPMAREVAEARSKETGYQKAIANYDDWVKRRTETVDALRARVAELEQEDRLHRGLIEHLQQELTAQRTAEAERDRMREALQLHVSDLRDAARGIKQSDFSDALARTANELERAADELTAALTQPEDKK